jgi:ATP-dependent exoDNAse (exonuclease V) beta subunit
MLKYSKDGKICFNPDFHTYTDINTGLKLKSVTKYVSEHKPIFDSIPIATAYAEKNGMNVDDVLKMWKAKSEASLVNGTAVHKVFEDYITYKTINTSGKHHKEEIAVKFIKEIFETNRLIPIEAELIVYEDNLAGQIDCIAKNEKDEYYILDWKTNEKIEKESFKGKTMFEPYDGLFDCNYYHYSLQTRLYQRLCKEYNITDAYIVHIGLDDYCIIKSANIILPSKL